MYLIEVKHRGSEDEEKWDEVLARSPVSTPFHTETWARVIEDCLGISITRLVALEEDEVIGIFPLAINRGPGQCLATKTLPFTATSPPIRKENPYGGPVVLPGKDDAITAFLRYIAKKKLSVDIIFSPDPGNRTRACPDIPFPSTALGQKSTYLIDLGVQEEELWSKCKKNMRNHIRKAQKSGVRVTRSRSYSDVKGDFYRLISRTYGRGGFKPLPPAFYARVFEDFGENASLFFAEMDGRRIGSEMTLVFGERAYSWSGGSDEEYWSASPNNLLSWEVIRWAKSKGLAHYDLCGFGPPSIAKFKSSLGGIEHSYPHIRWQNRLQSIFSSAISLKHRV